MWVDANRPVIGILSHYNQRTSIARQAQSLRNGSWNTGCLNRNISTTTVSEIVHNTQTLVRVVFSDINGQVSTKRTRNCQPLRWPSDHNNLASTLQLSQDRTT